MMNLWFNISCYIKLPTFLSKLAYDVSVHKERIETLEILNAALVIKIEQIESDLYRQPEQLH